jgi:hypothetical protein
VGPAATLVVVTAVLTAGAPRAAAQDAAPPSSDDRISRLEQELAKTKAELDEVKKKQAEQAKPPTAEAPPVGGPPQDGKGLPSGAPVAPSNSPDAWDLVPPSPAPKRSTLEGTSIFSWADRIRLGAWIFGGWGYETTSRFKDENAFFIGRAYLNVWGDLGHGLLIRFTPDINAGTIPFTDTNALPTNTGGPPAGGYTMRLKYAYLEADLGRWSDVLQNQRVKIGQIESPGIVFQEDLWDYRMQGKVFEENEGYVPSADDGVSWDGRVGPVSYTLMVDNGQGFTQPNIGRGKEIQGRLTAKLFGPLGVSSWFAWGDYSTGQEKFRLSNEVFVKNEWFTIAADVFIAHDPRSRIAGSQPGVLLAAPNAAAIAANPKISPTGDAHALGGSLFGVLPLTFLPHLEDFALISRVDYLIPDTYLRDVYHWRYIGGVSWRLNNYVRFLVDYDLCKYSAKDKAQPDSASALVQFELAF